MSDGKKLSSDREGHHAEGVPPKAQEEGERAQEEDHPQDEEHDRDEVHPGEEEEEGVHLREHCRPDLHDISSLPECHHLASQP